MHCVFRNEGNQVVKMSDAQALSGVGSADAAEVSSAGRPASVHSLGLARFPLVPPPAGHYESFYLKIADPESPRGAWIRHTVFKRPGEDPLGSLWCIVWPEHGQPVATKLTTADGLGVEVGEHIHVGESRMGPGYARGSANNASWDVTYSEESAPFTYQARESLYDKRFPRTKSLALRPLSTFHGRVALGDQELAIDGWPGMVGHNWGVEHAEEWIWLHGAGFGDAPEAWFDGNIGRLKVGRFTVPWIANACLSLDGHRYRLSGPGRFQSPIVEAERTRCVFTLKGSGITVRGSVEAPADRFVAWQYSDPAGGTHITSNCSVAEMRLEVTKHDGSVQRLHIPAGAAYELGRRGQPAEIPVQSFPDP